MIVKIGDGATTEPWTGPWIPGNQDLLPVALRGAPLNHDTKPADLI